MTAELQQLGVWHFCMGSESIPMAKLVTTDLLADASITLKLTAERNLSEATQSYNDAYRWNDQAVGTIMAKIKPSKYSGLENKSATSGKVHPSGMVWCVWCVWCVWQLNLPEILILPCFLRNFI